MTEEEQLRWYKEAVGQQALERQQQLAKQTCSSCGGRDGKHHQLCRRQYKRRGK